jgi:FKBP12-rapamycin complex-associated protein
MNEIVDEQAVTTINRIRAKLLGKDFKNKDPISVKFQVEKLIREAKSHENLCQSFEGWNAFL